MISLFGWGRKVRKLRKRWDRLREKSLKRRGLQKRLALDRLDKIENNVRMLEEQKLNRIDRARIAKEVEIELAEIKAILESKPEELAAVQKPQKT